MNLAHETTVSLGNAEVRGKFVTYKNHPFGTQHVLYSTLGLKIPTKPEVKDETNQSVPFELQPNTGSLDPLINLSYTTFQDN